MPLRVGVTGPTGEIGKSTIAALEDHPDVGQIIGMARRPFDPAEQGWTKTTYRQGDILDRGAVDELVADVDVVVHWPSSSSGPEPRAPGSISRVRATSSRRPSPPSGRAGSSAPRRSPPTDTTTTIRCPSPRTSRHAALPSTTTPNRKRRAKRRWRSSPRVRRSRSTCCDRASWRDRRRPHGPRRCRGTSSPTRSGGCRRPCRCSGRRSPTRARPCNSCTTTTSAPRRLQHRRRRTAVDVGRRKGARRHAGQGAPHRGSGHLGVADVDFTRGIVLPTQHWPDKPLKTAGSSQPVPIPNDLALLLSASVKRYPSPMMVTSGAAGETAPPWVIEREVRAARAPIDGLPEEFSFHDLRHYFASLLKASGADIKTVQARMRHGSARTTLDTYGHLWPDADEPPERRSRW